MISVIKEYSAIAIIAFIACLMSMSGMVHSQESNSKYIDFLNDGSELWRAGGNHTIEKTSNGNFVFKRYHATKLVITEYSTFTSKKLRTKEGLHYRKYDDGTLVTKGYYQSNDKVGEWIEAVNQRGFYEKGKKNGMWKRTNDEGEVVEETEYLDGKLHGIFVQYDSTGNIILEEEYQNGTRWRSSRDSADIPREELPRFPGCENAGLNDGETKKCADKTFLEYVYGSVRYPEEARQNGIEGTALFRFVIGTDGEIGEIKTLNGLSPDITKVCIDLIQKMPDWRPGMQNDIPVKVEFTLPIVFKLVSQLAC